MNILSWIKNKIFEYRNPELQPDEDWAFFSVYGTKIGSSKTQHFFPNNGRVAVCISRVPAIGATMKTWYNGTKIHRDDGPARVSVTPSHKGLLTMTGWYINNEKHRMDGPAQITALDGETLEKWFVRGVEVPPPNLLKKELVDILGKNPDGRNAILEFARFHNIISAAQFKTMEAICEFD